MLREGSRFFVGHPVGAVLVLGALYVALGPRACRLQARLEEVKAVAWAVALLVWSTPGEIVWQWKRRAQRRRRQ